MGATPPKKRNTRKIQQGGANLASLLAREEREEGGKETDQWCSADRSQYLWESWRSGGEGRSVGDGGEGAAAGVKEALTFLRQSTWTTPETLVLGFRILNLLPWSLAVKRKGPENLGVNLQERSGALFMTESPTSRWTGVAWECCLHSISSREALSFSQTELWIVWKQWSCSFE